MAEKTMKGWVGTWLTPSLIIGGIISGAFYVGDFQKDADTRMFETASQKEKTRAHIDSDYNEVRNYQLMEEQKQMKVQLDTAYAWVNARFQEDIAKRHLDSLNASKAIKSRALRDSLNIIEVKRLEQLSREQMITSNALQLILQKINLIEQGLQEAGDATN